MKSDATYGTENGFEYIFIALDDIFTYFPDQSCDPSYYLLGLFPLLQLKLKLFITITPNNHPLLALDLAQHHGISPAFHMPAKA